MTHTAGPWHWYEWERVDNEVPYYAINADADYKIVAKAYTKANAHLIAAAPELLAACEEALDELEIQLQGLQHADGSPDIRDQLQAVIAKARGA